jgi:hypothetical protein
MAGHEHENAGNPALEGPRRADTACDPHRVVDEKIRRWPGVRPILAALDAANGVKSVPRELLVREILGVVQRTQRCEKTGDVLPQREFADRLSGNDEMFLRRRSGRRLNLPKPMTRRTVATASVSMSAALSDAT